MESKKIVHFLYVPFTGLGLYDGFRGQRWLKNRIEVFKKYVVPSLLNQRDNDFILWVSWRPQEKDNQLVKELKSYLDSLFDTVFTYHGILFWDDKYKDSEAGQRLMTSLLHTLPELSPYCASADEILMTIQPSDDCYSKFLVGMVKKFFQKLPKVQAVGFKRGYIMNYATKEISEYNPNTSPPFYTIRFPKDTFLGAEKHFFYIGPYHSHEYVGDKLKMIYIEERGFIVGTHGENISTYYDHPFKGNQVDQEVLKEFGLDESPPLKFKLGLKRKVLKWLPHKVRRKVRYWFGELLYNYLRA